MEILRLTKDNIKKDNTIASLRSDLYFVKSSLRQFELENNALMRLVRLAGLEGKLTPEKNEIMGTRQEFYDNEFEKRKPSEF